jgi:tetratricopeptide (TPR) repeat protein
MFDTEAPKPGIRLAREVIPQLLARTVAASLCVSVVLFCASTQGGAQVPSRPVESPWTSLTRQLNRAISIAEHGDTQQALVLADALLEKHPDFVPALKLRGLLLEEAGRGADAAQAYEKALQIMPNDPVLLFKFGVNQLAVGDNDQAIHLFLRHLSILPRDGDALFYLAQAYHLNGQDDLALKAARESVKVAPDNAQVWQKYGELTCISGDKEAGLRLLMKARHIDPSLEQIDLDIGTAYFDTMDFSNAVRYFAKAADRQPLDLSALALLASAKVRLSQWQDARSVFQRILAIKKNDVDSLLGLGDCELELKQYQEAIDTLQRALQMDPTQMQSHYYLSRAYAGLGKTDEAQHEAELHQRMEQMSFAQPELGSEGNKSIWNQSRQLLTEQREDEALKLFQQGSKGASATPGDAHVFIGSLYFSMGNAEDALRNLHRALEIEPTVRGAHTYVGQIALQRGDLDAAEKEFEAELANDRNYLPAIAELGGVRYRQQRWAEAADLLSNSRTRNSMLLYMLCDSFFHLGKKLDAELTAEVLASYARSEPEAMRALIDLLGRNGESDLAQRLAGNPHP